MIKSTRTQITRGIFNALELGSKITVKFKTIPKDEDTKEAIYVAILSVPAACVKYKAVEELSSIKSRQYTGVLTSISTSGLCYLKLEDKSYKSFYLNNVEYLQVTGFVYSK